MILCYHGISRYDLHEWNPGLYMAEDIFRQRMRFLKDEGYAVLPLDEALRRLRAGTLPARAVALTFDDGTTDFRLAALPILEEFGFPATVYVATYYSEHQLPVFDTAMSYVLWRGRKVGADLAGMVDAPSPLPIGTRRERDDALRAIQAHVRAIDADAVAKDDLLRRVAACVGFDYAELERSRMHFLMRPDEIRTLPAGLVDVQLHTHRHRTPRDHRLFSREIEENRTSLEAMGVASERAVHFCYPSGDYAGEFLPWLRDLGVAYATTCVPGLVDDATSPLLLPRFVDTNAQSSLTFEAWVSGLAAFLPRRREYSFEASRLRVASA